MAAKSGVRRRSQWQVPPMPLLRSMMIEKLFAQPGAHWSQMKISESMNCKKNYLTTVMDKIFHAFLLFRRWDPIFSLLPHLVAIQGSVWDYKDSDRGWWSWVSQTQGWPQADCPSATFLCGNAHISSSFRMCFPKFIKLVCGTPGLLHFRDL